MLGLALYSGPVLFIIHWVLVCDFHLCALFDLELLVFWELSIKYEETLTGLLTTRTYFHVNTY